MKNLYHLKIPTTKSKKFVENFFISKNLKFLVELSNKQRPSVNQMIIDQPYFPELDDLYRLYQFIIMNKRTTVFEFGSGWSTLIFTLALNELKKKFSQDVKILRRNNLFELFVIEN